MLVSDLLKVCSHICLVKHGYTYKRIWLAIVGMMEEDPSVLHEPAQVILNVLSDDAGGKRCLPILVAEDFIRMHGELTRILENASCDIKRLRNRCGEKLRNSDVYPLHVAGGMPRNSTSPQFPVVRFSVSLPTWSVPAMLMIFATSSPAEVPFTHHSPLNCTDPENNLLVSMQYVRCYLRSLEVSDLVNASKNPFFRAYGDRLQFFLSEVPYYNPSELPITTLLEGLTTVGKPTVVGSIRDFLALEEDNLYQVYVHVSEPGGWPDDFQVEKFVKEHHRILTHTFRVVTIMVKQPSDKFGLYTRGDSGFWWFYADGSRTQLTSVPDAGTDSIVCMGLRRFNSGRKA